MNSEIYGGPTTLPWGFIFVHDNQVSPMHPTQIYEAIYCLITFGVTYWLYWKREAHKRTGLIFGVFLIGIFLSRFFVEFIKTTRKVLKKVCSLTWDNYLVFPLLFGVYG